MAEHGRDPEKKKNNAYEIAILVDAKHVTGQNKNKVREGFGRSSDVPHLKALVKHCQPVRSRLLIVQKDTKCSGTNKSIYFNARFTFELIKRESINLKFAL